MPTWTSFLSFISDFYHDFFVISFSETWLTLANIDAHGIVEYNHVGLTRGDKKGRYEFLLYSGTLIYTEPQELHTCLWKSRIWEMRLGQVTELQLSCHLVLLSIDSKTR